MRRWLWLFLIILCWAGAGFAIFAPAKQKSPGQADINNRADRIVSMAPNLTEILFALGLDEKIVAVSNDSDYPPDVADKKRIGTFWQPNIEAIIAVKPDLVITLEFNRQKNLARRLKRMGYNTLSVNIEKISGLFEAIKEIGTAADKKTEAQALAADIKKKLVHFSAQPGETDRPRVLYVVQRKPLRVAGRNTFINELIELAGGENAIGPTIYKYPPIGAEQVLGSGPDVIIESLMGQKDLTEQQNTAIQYWSRFENIPAVKNGRIYVIEADTVSRLGPRLYEAVKTIARCLRPVPFRN